MAILPQKLSLEQLMTKWAALLDPILKNPATDPVLIQNVVLATGTNLVDHRLGKKLTGWQVVGVNAPVTIYDTQATNPHPDRTLRLVSSGAATVSLLVF